MSVLKVAIIGYGAIGRSLHQLLHRHAPDVQVVAILVRALPAQAAHDDVGAPPLVDGWTSLMARQPDIVVECAGHAALRTYGAAALQGGCDLIVSSAGALADAEIETSLHAAARLAGSRLIIPSGAVGGLDALASARPAGIDEVVYTARKRPLSWNGTAAEELIDLAKVTEPTAFFAGCAREAALRFPKNANVVAAIALAGNGFENTTVTLIADPTTTGNRHDIRARGAFGEISISVLSHTLAENPKTSMLAPYSLMRAILNSAGPLVV